MDLSAYANMRKKRSAKALRFFLLDRKAVFADIDSNGGAFLGFSREEEAAEDVYAFREHGCQSIVLFAGRITKVI